MRRSDDHIYMIQNREKTYLYIFYVAAINMLVPLAVFLASKWGHLGCWLGDVNSEFTPFELHYLLYW